MLDVIFPEIDVRVVVHQAVIDGLMGFRQLSRSDVEGCGILLGRIYDGAIEITEFTPPQPTDRRERCGYTRHQAGHLEIATSVWKASGGLEGYVGEWHTHPESQPTPSSKDLSEGEKIARANREKLVALILGVSAGCIFIVGGQAASEPIYFRF